MTIFVGEQASLLPVLSAPYIPPITSDVVVDLSHWQAPVDFARAKSAGIAAVILKATQGSDWVDVAFAQRFAAASASGILVGAYHFLDDSPPKLQVENFLSVAEGCSVLALDAEPNAIGGTVTVAQTAEAAGRLNMATGFLPLIYINRYGPDHRGGGLPITSCPAARSGCPPTARGRFVHLAGRNGRCGSTPMERSVPMRCRSHGSADVTAADSPERSPI